MPRNPPWTADELILALDLYLREGQLDDVDAPVVELSATLNALPFGGEERAGNYRNPNSVAMKLANFAHFDPGYAGTGLASAGANTREVWERYSDAADEVARLAARLREVASGTVEPPPAMPVDGEDEAEEGRLLFRRHRVRERSRSLAKRKRDAARVEHGALRCEVCGLDPVAIYGDGGEAVIEVHHTVPLSEKVRTNRLADLALLCANCHAAIHADGRTRRLDELRAVING